MTAPTTAAQAEAREIDQIVEDVTSAFKRDVGRIMAEFLNPTTAAQVAPDGYDLDLRNELRRALTDYGHSWQLRDIILTALFPIIERHTAALRDERDKNYRHWQEAETDLRSLQEGHDKFEADLAADMSALEVLRELEWSNSALAMPRCPICLRYKPFRSTHESARMEGHAPDCRLNAALQQASGERER